MTKNEKLTYAIALSQTFDSEYLQNMRKELLVSGIKGKITSWGDIGLSSSISYDFNVGTAVEVITAALSILNGTFRYNKDRIRKFVL